MHCITGTVASLTEQLAGLEATSAELDGSLRELHEQHSKVHPCAALRAAAAAAALLSLH